MDIRQYQGSQKYLKAAGPGRSNAAPGFITTNREAKRRQRVERLLSGELRGKIRPASELMFDFEQASRIARRGNSAPIA